MQSEGPQRGYGVPCTVAVHVRCRARVLNTDGLNFMTGAAWCHGPGRAIPGGDGSPGDCGVPSPV